MTFTIEKYIKDSIYGVKVFGSTDQNERDTQWGELKTKFGEDNFEINHKNTKIITDTHTYFKREA